MLDSITADTRISGRVPGAGADDELCRVLGDQLVESNLVIAEDMDGGALENQVLVNVPSE